MKASNLVDVGHILRRNGTSTKTRTRPETLCAHNHELLCPLGRQRGSQTYMLRTLKMIRIGLSEKMLAMPTATQMTMDTTPALNTKLAFPRLPRMESLRQCDCNKKHPMISRWYYGGHCSIPWQTGPQSCQTTIPIHKHQTRHTV